MPWMETEDQLRQAVAFARYPPEGLPRHRRRAGDGLGGVPGRAHGRGQRPRAGRADHRVRPRGRGRCRGCARSTAWTSSSSDPPISRRPRDFAANGKGPEWPGNCSISRTSIRQAGKHCGVVATGTANLAERFEQGFRMLALGLDGGLLLRSLHESLAAVGRDRKIRSGFRDRADGRRVT